MLSNILMRDRVGPDDPGAQQSQAVLSPHVRSSHQPAGMRAVPNYVIIGVMCFVSSGFLRVGCANQHGYTRTSPSAWSRVRTRSVFCFILGWFWGGAGLVVSARPGARFSVSELESLGILWPSALGAGAGERGPRHSATQASSIRRDTARVVFDSRALASPCFVLPPPGFVSLYLRCHGSPGVAG